MDDKMYAVMSILDKAITSHLKCKDDKCIMCQLWSNKRATCGRVQCVIEAATDIANQIDNVTKSIVNYQLETRNIADKSVNDKICELLKLG